MSEFVFHPDTAPSEFGPLDERELASALSAERDGQQSWYAKMLDRYHEIHAYERRIRARSRIDDDREYHGLNKGRDDLHKQIERLGKLLGKSKDMVLADVIAREGNLVEYKLPEFGVLTPEQVAEAELGFIGNHTLADSYLERFTTATSEAALANKRRGDAWRLEHGVGREPAEVRTFKTRVAGMPDEQEFSFGLLPGEVVVIFGNTFTVDIQQESVEITPPGYSERTRRAVRAAEALRAKGVEARAFMHTVGAYHDTVTVVGVAIPVEKLQPETVGLLRNNRSVYGVRTEDMDAAATEAEYRAGLTEHTGVQSVEPHDILQFLWNDGIPNEQMDQMISLLEDDPDYSLSAADFVNTILERMPDVDRSTIQRAVEGVASERKRRAKEFQEEFLGTHERFFGKR